MVKIESVFAPYEEEIRAEIQRIQQEGESALIESGYYHTSEYEEDYYLDLLQYLQPKLLPF